MRASVVKKDIRRERSTSSLISGYKADEKISGCVGEHNHVSDARLFCISSSEGSCRV